MSPPNMPSSKIPADAQRLAFDYQQALTRLQEADERSRVLFEEIDRLNHQLDAIQNSKRTETDNRLRVEEALDNTRERLQLAVEATNLVLWDFKAPFQDFFLTAKWGEILGEVALEGNWSVEHLKARAHPDDFPAIEKGVGVLLAGYKERGVVEFRFRARDRWIWIQSHGIVAERDDKGMPSCLLGTLTDISERKDHEASLAQARELADRSSKAKSDFLTNISHEIRTPLNALMGLNGLLLDSTLNEEQRHWLELMSRSSQSLLKLLNDLLDLSRIEAGKLALEDVPFELRPFLETVCDLFLEQSKSKNVRFEKRFAQGLPVMMMGDPGRMGQVLNNLLSNAIKFTSAGGQVVFEASVQRTGADTRLAFMVQDSGIGISEDVIDHLFSAFTQADASIANRFGGSGMGLAICASLVELMQGQIRVESRVGKGSRFHVSLPLRLPVAAPERSLSPLPTPALAANPATEPPGLPLLGWKVLLAEDHPVNELVMRQMLMKFGCTIEVAHNGNEAVDIWQRGSVDLILMDVQMPECNGLMATERIRTLERGRAGTDRTPIIALTANAMNGDRERCLAAGMDAYLAKPVKIDTLKQAMLEARLAASASFTDGGRLPDAYLPQTSSIPAANDGPAAVDVEVDVDFDVESAYDDLSQLSPVIESDVVARMQEIDAALQAKDAASAQSAAHKLMSTLGFIDGERGVRLCRGLEMAANAGEWNLFARALPLLRDEVQHLLTQLRTSS